MSFSPSLGAFRGIGAPVFGGGGPARGRYPPAPSPPHIQHSCTVNDTDNAHPAPLHEGHKAHKRAETSFTLQYLWTSYLHFGRTATVVSQEDPIGAFMR